MNYDTSQDETEGIIRRTRKMWPDLAIVLVHSGKQIQKKQVLEQLGVDFIEGRPLNMDMFFHLLSEIFERKGAR